MATKAHRGGFRFPPPGYTLSPRTKNSSPTTRGLFFTQPEDTDDKGAISPPGHRGIERSISALRPKIQRSTAKKAHTSALWPQKSNTSAPRPLKAHTSALRPRGTDVRVSRVYPRLGMTAETLFQ